MVKSFAKFFAFSKKNVFFVWICEILFLLLSVKNQKKVIADELKSNIDKIFKCVNL
jgi:hypothetical protein